ncbi:MAG: extracellular catalytic domain type 1 short-chain-length polyhydroxyalkanoate depolymerase, partial [Burkholderiaceae bacterium]
LRTLRTWLWVRIGALRGRWHRGQVRAPEAVLFPGPFAALFASDRWRYGLYCPPGLDDAATAPLFVLLHGCKQSALRFAVATGWTAHADRARVRLLCPEQRRSANPYRCWNWFTPAAQRGVGEQAMILAAIDDTRERVAIDEGNVVVIGLSAGGAMAALLAFHHPARLRAAIAVAAPPLLGPLNVQDPRDVMKEGLRAPAETSVRHLAPCAPLAVIHGTADEVVNPRCAEQLIEQVLATHRSKDVTFSTISEAPFRSVDYRSSDGLVARRISIAGLAHGWTGGPGGHDYCEAGGAPLVALCAQFLRDLDARAPRPLTSSGNAG